MELFSTSPLANVVPAYLYEQYSDDESLQAFIGALNSVSQGYLDWFNDTHLALYTSDYISGQLLDFTANNIFGIPRPTISTLSKTTKGAINSSAINTKAINRIVQIQSGTAQLSTDDIYKRVMTWVLYNGDGKQTSILWFKRRISRFLYGINGTDVSVDELNMVSIIPTMYETVSGINVNPVNAFAINSFHTEPAKQIFLTIIVPSTSIWQILKSLLEQGILSMPYQVSFLVVPMSYPYPSPGVAYFVSAPYILYMSDALSALLAINPQAPTILAMSSGLYSLLKINPQSPYIINMSAGLAAAITSGALLDSYGFPFILDSSLLG